MKGSITRRGKSSWRLKFDAERDATGKRRIIYKTVRGTKREAEAEMTNTLAAFQKGNWIEPATLTVGAYLDRWLNDLAPRHG